MFLVDSMKERPGQAQGGFRKGGLALPSPSFWEVPHGPRNSTPSD